MGKKNNIKKAKIVKKSKLDILLDVIICIFFGFGTVYLLFLCGAVLYYYSNAVWLLIYLLGASVALVFIGRYGLAGD